MSLSTQPYKGARDFYPKDKRLQKYMFAKWRECAERYGYEEYDAPILEPLEIYLAKTGEEIVNDQTYVFEDRGGRKVVIRPEMTPTVSRMVAGKRQELPYPLRWYSIPNLWRYERPQRGRLREHWQLNVDLFGVASTDAEIELISLVDDIFKSFGASQDMYEIRVNHRGLIENMLGGYLGLSEESRHNTGKLIDRMQKMERSEFISKLDSALTDNERQEGVTEKLLYLLEINSVNELPEELKNHESFDELNGVLSALENMGMKHAKFDATLMRGFDYYTGIVFEVFDTDPTNNRSMMGGGRYDALVGLFGVEPVPTVGFGWGDVTLTNFLDVHHLTPKLSSETDVYMALAGDLFKDVQPFLKQLRNEGINVAVDMSGKKLGNQLKSADKLGINLVLIVGGDELSSGQYKLKNLKSGEEKTAGISEISKLLMEERENR